MRHKLGDAFLDEDTTTNFKRVLMHRCTINEVPWHAIWTSHARSKQLYAGSMIAKDNTCYVTIPLQLECLRGKRVAGSANKTLGGNFRGVRFWVALSGQAAFGIWHFRGGPTYVGGFWGGHI